MNYANLRHRDCLALHARAILRGAPARRHLAGIGRALRGGVWRHLWEIGYGFTLFMVYMLAAGAVIFLLWVLNMAAGGGR